MKNKTLPALLCITLALPACASLLDAVAASCPAGAAAVAGLRGVVGSINSAINDPPPAGSGSCSNGPTITSDPGAGTTATQVNICVEGQACNTVEVCESHADDTACNTCAKASCCAETAAFAVDFVARCLVGCQMQGSTLAECTTVCGGGPDAAYDALEGCFADHCADECKSLGLE